MPPRACTNPISFRCFITAGERSYSSSMIRPRGVLFRENLRICEDIHFNFQYLRNANKVFHVGTQLYNHSVGNPESGGDDLFSPWGNFPAFLRVHLDGIFQHSLLYPRFGNGADRHGCEPDCPPWPHFAQHRPPGAGLRTKPRQEGQSLRTCSPNGQRSGLCRGI